MTASTPPEEAQTTGAKPKAALMLPLFLVAALLVFLFGRLALASGPARLPSALIGKPIPEFDLPAVPKVLSDFGPVPGLSSGHSAKER